MKVEKEILALWGDLREHGDIAEITERFNLNRDAVGQALKTGECHSDIFLALNTFYSEKKKAIELSKEKITHNI